MRQIKYLFILSLISLLGCEKNANEHLVVTFKLDGKKYDLNGGFADYMHDIFDFTQLVGVSSNLKNGIQIDFKEKNSSDYDMITDTIAVYIKIGDTDSYISSNWTDNRPFAKFGKSFHLTISYRDDEKISGEFYGILYHLDTKNVTDVYDEIELKDGKFELMIK